MFISYFALQRSHFVNLPEWEHIIIKICNTLYLQIKNYLKS